MSIKGVLFDFDGTIGNTSNLIITSFRATISKFLGYEASDADIVQYFGLPLDKCMEKYDKNNIEAMVKYYRQHNMKHHDELIESFPCVKEVLERLKAENYKLAVVTSKTNQTALRGLTCLGIESYIDSVIGCDNVIHHKPHPEPMLKGANSLNLLPEECLCVGDSPFDLQSGKKANCKTVAVSWSMLGLDRLKREGEPDYIVNSMNDIINILELEKGGLTKNA